MKKKVVFDLDGTLSNNSHRLHWIIGDVKNWEQYTADCVDDVLKPDMLKIYNSHKQKGHEIYILSGRGESARKATVKWLEDNKITGYKLLLLRPVDCYTKDVDLKRQWLTEHKLGDSLIAYDDLEHNIEMFESFGIEGILVN